MKVKKDYRIIYNNIKIALSHMLQLTRVLSYFYVLICMCYFKLEISKYHNPARRYLGVNCYSILKNSATRILCKIESKVLSNMINLFVCLYNNVYYLCRNILLIIIIRIILEIGCQYYIVSILLY